MPKTDYKKLYSQYFGITWDTSKYQIHHIDGNHNNNEIDNLILLPVKLHQDLHSALCTLFPPDVSAGQAVQNYMHAHLNGFSDWFIGVALQQLIDAVYACEYWARLKNSGYYRCGGEKIYLID